MGLPGPSGAPGSGSLTAPKILTIYKGDKVTAVREGASSSTFTHAPRVHTHTHAHMKGVRLWTP